MIRGEHRAPAGAVSWESEGMEVCILTSLGSGENGASIGSSTLQRSPLESTSGGSVLFGRFYRIDNGQHDPVKFLVGDFIYLQVLEEGPVFDQLHVSARLDLGKRSQGLNFEEFVIGEGLKEQPKSG